MQRTAHWPRIHSRNMATDSMSHCLRAAGSMYPFFVAMGTVALVSTLGACMNYELSARLVRDMVVDLMPGKLSAFHRSVSRHQENLLSYFVFLRARTLKTQTPCFCISYRACNLDQSMALRMAASALVNCFAPRACISATSVKGDKASSPLMRLPICVCR